MNQNQQPLSGQIIVVAGAGGGGLGTTVTRQAAEAGATVIGVSRRQDNLDEHLGPMVSEGLSVVPVAADIETDDGVATVMERVRSTDGELYGLVTVVGGDRRPVGGQQPACPGMAGTSCSLPTSAQCSLSARRSRRN